MALLDWIVNFLADVTDLSDIRLDYIPIWISDFLADENVQVMTTEQKGAYLLLLMRAWQQDLCASLPNDEKKLSQWCGLSASKWKKNRAAVMAPWALGQNDRYYQKRLCSEWLKAAKNYLGRKRGAETANAQRGAQRGAQRTLSDRSAEVQRSEEPNPTPPYRTPPNQTPPNPTGQRGADGEGGASNGGVGKGENGEGGNMGDAARQLAVDGILSGLGVGDEVRQKLSGRHDVTPTRIQQLVSDIRRDPGVRDIGGVLVARLNRRGVR